MGEATTPAADYLFKVQHPKDGQKLHDDQQ